MAELLETNLRDRCRSLFGIGNCYLAYDDGVHGGDPRDVRYVPAHFRDWETLTDEELELVWLSPNSFEPHLTRGKANFEVFWNEFGDRPGVIQTTFMGLAIRVADLTEDIMETLASLCDYPVLDDMKLSEMESEAQRESWDNWERQNFERLIEGYLKGPGELIESVEICSDDADEEAWFWFFCDRLNATGGEWIESSDGGWSAYPIEEAAKTVTLQNLEKLGIEVQINLWEA